MSTWHDIASAQPADAQLAWVRRGPGDCPPFAATWDAAHAQFLCGPEQWVIPWQFVFHWRDLATAPAWPQPRSGTSSWQDIYLCPPADGQSAWVRRCPDDSAAFRAVFDRAGGLFTLARGWQIHWYEACKWRPG